MIFSGHESQREDDADVTEKAVQVPRRVLRQPAVGGHRGHHHLPRLRPHCPQQVDFQRCCGRVAQSVERPSKVPV